MTERTYPDGPADAFPAPPASITDAEGREIDIRVGGTDDFDALADMYERFDPADRAQGIPPVERAAVEEWLDGLLTADSIHVVAVHEGDVVGHAVLVPDRGDAYELAIFVLGDYQGAGIGTELLERLLGHGQEVDVDRVWLTVERWNNAAIALYRKLGFETSDSESFELEMAIRL